MNDLQSQQHNYSHCSRGHQDRVGGQGWGNSAVFEESQASPKGYTLSQTNIAKY